MPAKAEPTESEQAFMQANPDMTTADFARRFGRSKETVKRWRDELGISNPAQQYARRSPEVVEPPSAPSIDLPPEMVAKSGMWKSLEWYQREVQKRDPRVEEASVTLPDDKPVMVVFSSDWHLGHLECDMGRLWSDLELVANTPGVYIGAGGDLLDNTVSAVAGRGMLFESMSPPEIQMELVEEAAALVPPERWLFVCLGNHEAWTINAADHDPMAHFAAHVDTAYFGAWGFLHLTVGTYTYDILAGHKFSGTSKINKTGMVKNAMNLLGDADAVFAGHVHNYAVEESETRRRGRFYAVAGTYLKTSRYGRSLGFANTQARMPGAILFPNERHVQGTSDAFGHGIHLLSTYRDDVTCDCVHCQRKRGVDKPRRRVA